MIGCPTSIDRKGEKIKRMRVYQEYQRQGFGQIILQKLTEAAKQQGYTELCLDTLPQNIPAQKLYEKYGLTSEHIVEAVRKVMGRKNNITSPSYPAAK